MRSIYYKFNLCQFFHAIILMKNRNGWLKRKFFLLLNVIINKFSVNHIEILFSKKFKIRYESFLIRKILKILNSILT